MIRQLTYENQEQKYRSIIGGGEKLSDVTSIKAGDGVSHVKFSSKSQKNDKIRNYSTEAGLQRSPRDLAFSYRSEVTGLEKVMQHNQHLFLQMETSVLYKRYSRH